MANTLPISLSLSHTSHIKLNISSVLTNPSCPHPPLHHYFSPPNNQSTNSSPQLPRNRPSSKMCNSHYGKIRKAECKTCTCPYRSTDTSHSSVHGRHKVLGGVEPSSWKCWIWKSNPRENGTWSVSRRSDSSDPRWRFPSERHFRRRDSGTSFPRSDRRPLLKSSFRVSWSSLVIWSQRNICLAKHLGLFITPKALLSQKSSTLVVENWKLERVNDWNFKMRSAWTLII